MNLYPLAFLVFCSCAVASLPSLAQGPPQTQFPLIEKATLRFTTDAGVHQGTAVLKRQTSRKFVFDIPKNASELYLDTCHREVAAYKPPVSFSWTYIPVLALQAPEPIEYAGNCLLILTVISQTGVRLRAIASFSGDEDAPAESFCNGEKSATVGHTFCQARADTTQAIVFSQQMHATWKDSCTPLRSKDNRGFAFNQAPGLCTYAFLSFDKKQAYRMTTFGYTVVPMPDYVMATDPWLVKVR